MKASELIKELQEKIKIHGDLDVCIYIWGGTYLDKEIIDGVEIRDIKKEEESLMFLLTY